MSIKSASGLNALASRKDVQKALAGIEYRVARTREELEQAYALVYREYLRRHYTEESRSKLRLSIHNALPQVTTFVGIMDGEVLTTATAIPDSPLGLPMDSIYRGELSEFRGDGENLCEISMLASDSGLFRKGASLLLSAKMMLFVFFLFKCVFDYVRETLDADFICITINPRHKLIYDFLLFRELGETKAYEYANGAPAVARYLDVKSAEEECLKNKKEGLHRMFFERKTDADSFSRKVVLTAEDLRYLFTEQTDIFRNARPREIEYIKSSYPDYDFSRILP